MSNKTNALGRQKAALVTCSAFCSRGFAALEGDHHDKHSNREKRDEHRWAGQEDHPFYVTVFDCSHMGPYQLTPDCSIA